MLTISMTTFNRSAYLKECLGSFLQTVFVEPTRLVITDDCSTDESTLNLLREFSEIRIPNLETIIRYRTSNLGCDRSVLESIEYCFNDGAGDWVLVQDSDAVFNKMWLVVLKSVMGLVDLPVYALTVWKFRCAVLGEHKGLDILPGMNGMNALLHREIFNKIKWEPGVCWDTEMSRICTENKYPMLRTRQSFVKHIGVHGVHLFDENATIDFVE